MYYTKINNKEFWPYEAIMHSWGDTEGDIRPIIFDNAEIDINWNTVNYSLCYKISKNLFWKEIKYADIINESSGEVFSFQVNNIFLIKVYEEDLKLLARIWENLKFYENFWKTDLDIEPDWDKADLEPLWYFDMFLSYDDDFYYPLILDKRIKESAQIKRFWDYYWFRSYVDVNWGKHFLLLIQDENDDWYWVDNFKKISQNIDFWNDTEEIETWNITQNWKIYTETNLSNKYYLDDNWVLVKWIAEESGDAFLFLRHFEDTNSDYIIWKNTNGLFIINRNQTDIDEDEQKNIFYFKKYISFLNKWKDIYFLMEKNNWEVVFVNKDSDELILTDLDSSCEVSEISFDGDILNIKLKNWELRKYT